MKKGKIGLSLSRCVGDIVEGKINIEDVEKIITGACWTNDAEWEDTIQLYKQNDWCWSYIGQDGRKMAANPDEAEKIARQLLAEGKIEQPRLKDPSRYPLRQRRFYSAEIQATLGEDAYVTWVDSEEDIQWSNNPDDD